jgi:membrane protease YdiL (CAAX protease family)
MSSLSYITESILLFAKKLVQEVKAMATLQHTSFQSFIKKHPVLTYYVLTFAISWGVVLLVIGGSDGIPGTSSQSPRLLAFQVAALYAGPAVAGLLLTGLVSGRAGFRKLLSRLLTWRVSARWYAVALLTAPLMWTAVLLVLSLLSPVFLPGIVTTSDKAYPLLMGIVGGLIVGFFEELGWTGFATPRLRLRYGILTTGLIIGVLWGVLYIPTYDLWGSSASFGSLPVPLFLSVYGLSFLVGHMPAFRVLMVWVYDRTGSLLVAILMHASLLACIIIFAPAATGVAFLVYSFAVAAALWVIVAAVAVANGGKLSRGENSSAISVTHTQ